MAFDKQELQQLEDLFEKQRIQFINKLDEQRVELIGKIDEQRVELIAKIDGRGTEFINKLDEQRLGIMSDVRSLLQPIKDDLVYVKQRLDLLFKTESEDVQMNYKEIEFLKKKVKQLEVRLAALEH